MNLYNHIKLILSENETFCKDGVLFKNSVVEAGLKLDPELLKLLLEDDKAKKHFFTEVNGIAVFDKTKFQKFVSNKQFLPDSFTAYKNKIGLTANGEYLTEANEVVLDFPYKDCVLEGGQTKEDQKRQEIFWNETLAPDEIDRLFEPKVFTNWKRYDKDGEQKVKKLDKTDNLIIKGNNLLALHSLLPVYKGKVKLIYIDPPYNTGDDEFNYNDSFNHSTWLTFMKNRLNIAKEMLRKDGFFCIQISDIEVAYLEVLCNQIFGRENLISTISVKMAHLSGTKMAHKTKKIPKIKEHLLLYSRNKSNVLLRPQYIPVSWEDAFSRYNSYVVKNDFKDDDCDKWEIITVNQALKKYNIDSTGKYDFLIQNAENIFRTARNRSADYSDCDPNVFVKYIKDPKKPDEFHFVYKNEDVSFASEKIRVFDGKKQPSSILGDIWSDIGIKYLSNEGGVSLRFGKKPEKLIHRIISLCTDENDIVCDFFLGSGTSAAVSHKINRQYIGIEQLDYGDNDSTARLKNVISGENVALSDLINWQGGGSFIYAELTKDNAAYVERIQSAEDNNTLLALWEEIKDKPFISYKVNPQDIDSSIDAFQDLSLDAQKKLLISLLDKNLLYVNYNDIGDTDHGISKEDKALNQQFYSL